jgi:micrococcal nuclease
VVDGDTVDLLLGGRQERVRLIGVDTPETKHPDKPVECFGPEASAFTAQTLDQHQVWLTYKPDERYDKYGRLLAYLWLDLDGDPEVELFNQELVARGYARVYPFFPFEYLDQFRQAEAQALSQGLGLWGECGYQPYR